MDTMLADAAWFANDVAVGAAVVSLSALIVSVASARYAQRQARASERQTDEATKSRQLNERALAAQAGALEDQAKNTTTALALAERSALAAERSAEATRVLAETGQRAWLSQETLIVAHRTLSGLPDSVISTVRNAGSTPASNVEIFQWWNVYSGIDPDHLHYPDTPVSSRSVIGPRGAAEIPSSINLDSDRDVGIRKGSEFLLVHGLAKYDDVFGGKHKTEWCLWYVPQTQQFSFTPKFNESD